MGNLLKREQREIAEQPDASVPTIAIMGPSGVGKTHIAGGQPAFDSTIEDVFHEKSDTYGKYDVMDTGGINENYSCFFKKWVEGSQGIIFVFSYERAHFEKSLKELAKMLDKIPENKYKSMPVLLVGNKRKDIDEEESPSSKSALCQVKYLIRNRFKLLQEPIYMCSSDRALYGTDRPVTAVNDILLKGIKEVKEQTIKYIKKKLKSIEFSVKQNSNKEKPEYTKPEIPSDTEVDEWATKLYEKAKGAKNKKKFRKFFVYYGRKLKELSYKMFNSKRTFEYLEEKFDKWQKQEAGGRRRLAHKLARFEDH